MPAKNQIENIVGKRFGRLVVKNYIGQNKSRKSVWNCVCDCGNEIAVNKCGLVTKNTTSCGCYNKDVISHPYGQASIKRVLKRYKASASKKGFSFEISEERFASLLSMNCYYCGTPPSKYAKDGRANGGVFYNGIDRIDSSKGYVEGNIVPCCKNCNYAKNTMSYNEFTSWVQRIADHMLSRKMLFSAMKI